MGVAACQLHVTWARISILRPHLSLILRTASLSFTPPGLALSISGLGQA